MKTLVALAPETAVPVFELRDSLSIFQNLHNPSAWTGHFRGSLAKWKPDDGEAVVAALFDAESNPTRRPVDIKKLHKMPPVLRAKSGLVTVPEDDSAEEHAATPANGISEASAATDSTSHTEIQWLLLKLGSDMGLDVWVAKNDKGKEFQGHQFKKLARFRKELPLQFDEATNRTIELIDVLWLQGNAIVAAFEIESTTSIYSG